MSDNDNDRDLEDTPAEQQAPHRVIGTPPPAPGILTDPGRGDGDDGGKGTEPYGPGEAEAPELEELPAENPNPASARNWERVAAALFIISALASVAFIAAYVGLEVDGDTKGNVVVATLRSNLALGTAMSLAFLAIGIGMVIWVRNVMPPVELAEERHPMASPEEDRTGVRGDDHRGRGGQPDHQAPAAAAHADRGHDSRRARARWSSCAAWGRCPRAACGPRCGRRARGCSSTGRTSRSRPPTSTPRAA